MRHWLTLKSAAGSSQNSRSGSTSRPSIRLPSPSPVELPLLSRLGGQLTPIEDATPLYALAAERTLAQLGSESQIPSSPKRSRDLLKLRDASLTDCESLIAGMLARRDQWLLLLPGIVPRKPTMDRVQATLEEPFRREHQRCVQALHNEFAHNPGALEDLLDLARIAYSNGQEQLLDVCGIRSAADLTDVAHWQCLCHLLLTKDDRWRSRIATPEGFPPNTHRGDATQLKSLIQNLR